MNRAVGHDGPLGTELTALGFPVHYVNLMERRLAPLRALRLARLTDRLAPDIVHLHGTRAAFMHALGGVAHGGLAPCLGGRFTPHPDLVSSKSAPGSFAPPF